MNANIKISFNDEVCYKEELGVPYIALGDEEW